MDREHREVAGAYPVEDRGLLLRAPRRLADREERERPSVAQRGRVERADVVDPLRSEAVELGNLRDADRGLVEHAVHARGPVAVRRDLGDEQQAISHRTIASSNRLREDRPVEGAEAESWSTSTTDRASRSAALSIAVKAVAST